MSVRKDTAWWGAFMYQELKTDNTTEYSEQFRNLRNQILNGSIKLGISSDYANKAWFSNTIVGKVMNLLTYPLIIGIFFFLIKTNLQLVLLTFSCLVANVLITRKFASYWLKMKVLGNETVFRDMYNALLINLLDNTAGTIIKHPSDWRNLV